MSVPPNGLLHLCVLNPLFVDFQVYSQASRIHYCLSVATEVVEARD